MKPENDTPQSSNNTLDIFSDDYSQDVDLKRIQGKYSPASIFLITIIGIAVAEVIAMVVVYFQRQRS
jgi:hypothetical protein